MRDHVGLLPLSGHVRTGLLRRGEVQPVLGESEASVLVGRVAPEARPRGFAGEEVREEEEEEQIGAVHPRI